MLLHTKPIIAYLYVGRRCFKKMGRFKPRAFHTIAIGHSLYKTCRCVCLRGRGLFGSRRLLAGAGSGKPRISATGRRSLCVCASFCAFLLAFFFKFHSPFESRAQNPLFVSTSFNPSHCKYSFSIFILSGHFAPD